MGEGAGTMGRNGPKSWDGGPVLKAEIVLQPGMGVWMGFWERNVDANGNGKGEGVQASEKGSLVEV